MKAQNQRNGGPKKPWRTFWVVNAVGADFAVCVFAGYYVGSYIQRITGQVLWLAAFLLIGIGVGIWTVILILMRYLGGGDP
mgnify:CR=1 FL=1